jgi:CRISPR/Cas system-associated protein Csm6
LLTTHNANINGHVYGELVTRNGSALHNSIEVSNSIIFGNVFGGLVNGVASLASAIINNSTINSIFIFIAHFEGAV